MDDEVVTIPPNYKRELKEVKAQVAKQEFETDIALTKKSIGQGHLTLIAIQAIVNTIIIAFESTPGPYNTAIISLGFVNIAIQCAMFVFITAQANMRVDDGIIRASTMNTLVTVLSQFSLIITTVVTGLERLGGNTTV
jgi:hypothetical protein